MKCQRCGRNVFHLKSRTYFDNFGRKIEGQVCKQCAYEIDEHHEKRGSYRDDASLHNGYNIKRKAASASEEGRRQR